MKCFSLFAAMLPLLLALSCSKPTSYQNGDSSLFSMEDVAKMISELPLSQEHLDEVFDAVNSSSGNGYDEEYMMKSLFSTPGAGVGDSGTKAAGRYKTPMRDLMKDYLASKYSRTKAGAADVQKYIDSLSESDMQIYWPYSEYWDGEEFPIVTFDPGHGATSNYGYELRMVDGGLKVVDSVLVTEQVAKDRPVWVINKNDDSSFTPFEPDTRAATKAQGGRVLTLKSFKMLRNYDSWFAGASEFYVQFGAVDGFRATSDEDLKKYAPTITDFIIVVKRSQLGLEIPFNSILLTDFTDQMESFAMLITEDDGGTTTSWKSSANVRYKSKTYGFDIEIPYKDKDDIVWRGQLSGSFLSEHDEVTGRFGDVAITFALE